MRTWFLAAAAGLATTPCLWAQDEGSSLAAAAEFSLEALPGPNTGDAALPKPLLPRPLGVEPGDEAPTFNTGAVHLSLGMDLSNAYFYRGLRIEDDGLIAQPWATVGMDLVNNDTWTLQAIAGSWNSWHDEETDAGTDDGTLASWYESDIYFGLTAATGNWEVGAQYGWFVSPSDAFTTVEELQFSVSYDDSECLEDFALAPSAMVIIETGEGTSDGFGKGVYAQVAIEPSLALNEDETLNLSFPVIVGVSASDYYEHDDGEGAAGDDDFFGFASVGATLAFELPVSDRYGAWSCYVGVNAQLLGDLATEYNDDDDTAFVASAGISVEY